MIMRRSARPDACTGADTVGGDATTSESSCDLEFNVVVGGQSAPVTPGGISRLADDRYFLTYTRTNEFGRPAVYGLVTPDLICGPYGDEETIASSSSEDYLGPYPGLEPGGETFLIAFTAPDGTRVVERSAEGVVGNPAPLQPGLTAVSMQRIGSSLKRMTIAIEPAGGSISTQTVETADPSSWSSLLSTKFGVSTGTTGSNFRATAGWSANPAREREIVMAWEYVKGGGVDRAVRYGINSNYRDNDDWTAARTLVTIAGKDLSDPFVFRWKGEVRVYFAVRDAGGASSLASMASADYGDSWTGPHGVCLPIELAGSLTDLTAPTVGKALDGEHPVILVGGFVEGTGSYELVAFEQRP
jgi:hypothetical protein